MENNNFNNNPMKPEENIEKVETPVTPEPKVEVNINQPKVEVNIGQPEVKVTVEQPKVEPVTEQAKPESKMQKFKSAFKDKMGKFKNFAVKKKPLVIAASVLLVAGITTGITVGAVAASGGFVTPVKDKFDKMKAYYKDYLIRNTNIDNYKDLSAKQILKRGVYWKTIDGEKFYTKLVKIKLGADIGYFMEDIDYNDGSNRDSWPASSHVSQNLAIAVTATVKHDPEMMKIAVGMTNYWVYNNFRNTNWWHNELGAGANTLANVGIFVFDHLSSLAKSLLCSKVAKASFYYRQSLLTHAGTNLFDYADITLRSSIFTKNEDEFNLVVKRIQDEITDRHLEGFQKDGSFFQHGQQVQIASYGKGVIRLAKVLKAISVSGEEFSEEKMHIIERYLLTGLRNMTHKGYLNYSAMSREYVRKNNLSAASNNFSQFSEYLDIPEFTKHDELKAYLDSIENKQACADELTYFNRAQMITANIDGLYMSFKGTADYLTNTECVNSENRLGLNLSYGTNTCVMDNGDEYYNISPLWNYAYIPGTTSIQLTKDATEEATEFSKPETTDKTIYNDIVNKIYQDELYERQLPPESGSTVYNGGIYPKNNNEAGTEIAVSMQKSTHHDENKFTVTCITCKDGMLLLGQGLTYIGNKTEKDEGETERPDAPFEYNSRKLHTTLEQCFYKGSHELRDNDKILIHGNAVYKIVDPVGTIGPGQKIEVKTQHITETEGWIRNRNAAEGEGDLDAEGTTLIAYIQHEGRENESYAYSIQPKSKFNRHFTVYKNSEDVQEVVLPDDKTVIIAYKGMTSYTDHLERTYQNLKPGDVIVHD